MDKLFNNLSGSRTLYDEMIRLYNEKKENIISGRKILVMDQHFEGITGITRSVLSSIKKGKSRPKLCTIATFCVSLKIGVLESLNLFELAGYKLSENYEVDRAYLYLIQNNENGDIEESNEYLESIGVEKQHYLGVKSRE